MLDPQSIMMDIYGLRISDGNSYDYDETSAISEKITSDEIHLETSGAIKLKYKRRYCKEKGCSNKAVVKGRCQRHGRQDKSGGKINHARLNADRAKVLNKASSTSMERSNNVSNIIIDTNNGSRNGTRRDSPYIYYTEFDLTDDSYSSDDSDSDDTGYKRKKIRNSVSSQEIVEREKKALGIKPGNCKRQDRLNAENEEKLNQATLPSKKAKRKRDKILNPSRSHRYYCKEEGCLKLTQHHTDGRCIQHFREYAGKERRLVDELQTQIELARRNLASKSLYCKDEGCGRFAKVEGRCLIHARQHAEKDKILLNDV